MISVTTVLACGPGRLASKEPSPPPSTGLDPLRVAERAHDRGDYNQASALAHRVAQENQKRAPQAWAIQARAQAALGNHDKSIGLYQQALESGFAPRTLIAELGSVLDVLGRYQEAVAVYAKHLAAHPDDTVLWHQRGLSELLGGDAPAANQSLQTAHRLAPDNTRIRIDWAYALLAAGDPKKAEDVVAGLLARRRSDEELVVLTGKLHALLGRMLQALTLLSEDVAANPDHTQSQALLDYLERQTGHERSKK